MPGNLYWIENPYCRLAIGPRPRGEEWLTDEVRAYRVHGVDTIVSLLTTQEADELGLGQEADACKANKIGFLNLPIEDRAVPTDRRLARELIDGVHRRLESGEHVAIHCRIGIGRSAMVAAAVLTRFGMDLKGAFERIASARGCPVPDTDEQREWVAQFVTVDK